MLPPPIQLVMPSGFAPWILGSRQVCALPGLILPNRASLLCVYSRMDALDEALLKESSYGMRWLLLSAGASQSLGCRMAVVQDLGFLHQQYKYMCCELCAPPGKGGDFWGAGRAAHTDTSACRRAADAAGIPQGMWQVGGEAPQLAQADTGVPGEIPRGWKSVLLRHGFTGGLKMDASRQTQLSWGQLFPRCPAAWPEPPGFGGITSAGQGAVPHPGESISTGGRSSPCRSCSAAL